MVVVVVVVVLLRAGRWRCETAVVVLLLLVVVIRPSCHIIQLKWGESCNGRLRDRKVVVMVVASPARSRRFRTSRYEERFLLTKGYRNH